MALPVDAVSTDGEAEPLSSNGSRIPGSGDSDDTDLWDGYRPARKRLIETIRRHELTNVVIATGDHHRHRALSHHADGRSQ